MHQQKPEQNDSRARRVATPHLRRIITEFYRNTLDEYERAGFPFGITVEAMLIWFEYGQDTRLN
ncbi:MAG TPA: hypothetical protein VFG50_12305 [Rhodothermales bacterium]|nr:hypothetical protein [Rhodothermales bacterium]